MEKVQSEDVSAADVVVAVELRYQWSGVEWSEVEVEDVKLVSYLG